MSLVRNACGPFVLHLAANLRVGRSKQRLPFKFWFPEYKTFLFFIFLFIFACSSHDYCMCAGTLFGGRISIYPDKAAFSPLFCVFVLKLPVFGSMQSFDCSPLASTVKFGIPFPISLPIHFLFVFPFSISFQSGSSFRNWITYTARSGWLFNWCPRFGLICHQFQLSFSPISIQLIQNWFQSNDIVVSIKPMTERVLYWWECWRCW